MKTLTVTLNGQTGELIAAPRYRKQIVQVRPTCWRGGDLVDLPGVFVCMIIQPLCAQGVPQRGMAKYSLN